MQYYKELRLRDGRSCILRSAEPEDAAAFLRYFVQAHSETDFLTTCPNEASHTQVEMAERLARTLESPTDLELCAFLDGQLIGSAGNHALSRREKLRHRAEYGISILKEYWGLGIGSALTACCIECAKAAGFLQLELEVVAENRSALRLYEKFGFTEYGRNPRGFRTRDGRWQELILMRLELQ